MHVAVVRALCQWSDRIAAVWQLWHAKSYVRGQWVVPVGLLHWRGHVQSGASAHMLGSLTRDLHELLCVAAMWSVHQRSGGIAAVRQLWHANADLYEWRVVLMGSVWRGRCLYTWADAYLRWGFARDLYRRLCMAAVWSLRQWCDGVAAMRQLWHVNADMREWDVVFMGHL